MTVLLAVYLVGVVLFAVFAYARIHEKQLNRARSIGQWAAIVIFSVFWPFVLVVSIAVYVRLQARVSLAHTKGPIRIKLPDGRVFEGTVTTSWQYDDGRWQPDTQITIDAPPEPVAAQYAQPDAPSRDERFAKLIDEVAASHARVLALGDFPRCEAMNPHVRERVARCLFWLGHLGAHRDVDGYQWSDPRPCFAAVALGGVPGTSHVLTCSLLRDHDGPHQHPSLLGPVSWSHPQVDDR